MSNELKRVARPRRLGVMTIAWIALSLTPAEGQSKAKVKPKITTEELQAHPERFHVAEVDQAHYIVFDREISSLNDLKTRLLVGRLGSLHLMDVRSSSAEIQPTYGAVQFSVSARRVHHGYLNSTVLFEHPPPVRSDEAERGDADQGLVAEARVTRPAPSLKISCQKHRKYVGVDGKEIDEHPLRFIPSAEASSLLRSAKVTPPPFKVYTSHALLRDEWGRYYFVERSRLTADVNDFRLWVGYRGEMKKVPVITAAVDSKGVVLVSKEAAMRLVTNFTRQSACQDVGALWVERAGERKELIDVPVRDNQTVIHSQLGIYDQLYLGDVCDILDGILMPRLDHPEELPPSEIIRYHFDATKD